MTAIGRSVLVMGVFPLLYSTALWVAAPFGEWSDRPAATTISMA
jgi:hypothetical protein